MLLSSASSASMSRNPAGLVRAGTLTAKWHQDEPIFVSNANGPTEGFSSLGDAVRGAAGLSQQSGAAYAVVQEGGHLQTHELVQPVWRGTHAAGYEGVELTPLEDDAHPKFGFVSKSADRWGGRDDSARTGHVEIDPRSGVEAIVGATWAFVNGRLQAVTPSRPQPPVPPTQPPTNPPTNPPVPPTQPPTNPGGRTLVEDVTEAARLATAAAGLVGQVPADDHGDESTKELRIKAYKTNMAAQARLETQFDANNTASVVSTLRTADASLEDANWQLAKKPSPDGRFNGVDQPGALRDTQRAVDLLNGLLGQLTTQGVAA
ncbi:MAG: hypothetical protein JWM98_487 [Thermoleophilia bacterium]|nr:hypothetical protein [Thermoleophilia bacterium]